MWQTLLAVAFWVAVWQGLAVCIGHNGLFLATPLQTVQTLWRLLPTADFWHRVGFSALRILTGFVLAVTVGLLLGACGARWRWFGTLVGPVMQLIRAMPVASFVILALFFPIEVIIFYFNFLVSGCLTNTIQGQTAFFCLIHIIL